MRLLIGFFFIAITLYSCIGGVSEKSSQLDNYYEQRQKSFDILTLIDTLIGPYGNNWSRLADIRQINWKSKDILTPDQIYDSPFSRVGNVYITMDSIFTDFKIEERNKPVPLKVTLSGARTMYFALILENGIVSESFEGFSGYFKKKNVLSKENIYKCYPNAMDCIYRNMLITVNAHPYTVVEKNQFTLTGGPAMEYTYYIVSGWEQELNSLPAKNKPKKLEPVEVQY